MIASKEKRNPGVTATLDKSQETLLGCTPARKRARFPPGAGGATRGFWSGAMALTAAGAAITKSSGAAWAGSEVMALTAAGADITKSRGASGTVIGVSNSGSLHAASAIVVANGVLPPTGQSEAVAAAASLRERLVELGFIVGNLV